MDVETKFPKLVKENIESRISSLLPFILNVDGACHISSKSGYIDTRLLILFLGDNMCKSYVESRKSVSYGHLN